MLVALDISLTTGVAWGASDQGAPHTALWTLPKGEHQLDRAFAMLGDLTRNLIRTHGVADVAVESVLLKVGYKHSAYSLFLLASLGAVVRSTATGLGCRVFPVDVRTWRKTVLGNGNLTTEAAVEGIFRRCTQLGWDHKNDHNVAEACGLWYHQMSLTHPRWRPARQKIVPRLVASS